jgi:alkylation response protein AidB-like acyl-CoA dehydrogenase
MEMAKNCRHCGEPLDEATFFLDEASMLKEIMAIRQANEEAKALRDQMTKRVRLYRRCALVALTLSGVMMATGQTAVQVGGGLLTIAGAALALLALSASRKLEAASEPVAPSS